MLTKKQIDRFLVKIAGEKFPIKYYCDENDLAPVSYLRTSWISNYEIYLIYINKCWFKDNEKPADIFLKAALLHEIGHYKMGARSFKSGSLKEYEAQVWAIKRAKKLKMNKLVRVLKGIMREWLDGDWKGYRIYVTAAKMAKKKGII